MNEFPRLKWAKWPLTATSWLILAKYLQCCQLYQFDCQKVNRLNLICLFLWKLPLFWTKLWKLSKIAHFALHEIFDREIEKSWEHWLIGWSIEIYLLFSICEPDARLIFAAISVTLSLQDQWVNFSHIQWQHSD